MTPRCVVLRKKQEQLRDNLYSTFLDKTLRSLHGFTSLPSIFWSGSGSSEWLVEILTSCRAWIMEGGRWTRHGDSGQEKEIRIPRAVRELEPETDKERTLTKWWTLRTLGDQGNDRMKGRQWDLSTPALRWWGKQFSNGKTAMLPEELIEHKNGKLALHPREHPMVLEKERKGLILELLLGAPGLNPEAKEDRQAGDPVKSLLSTHEDLILVPSIHVRASAGSVETGGSLGLYDQQD